MGHGRGLDYSAFLPEREHQFGKEFLLRVYVGNLPYETTEEDLEETFGAYGQVESATVIRDRQTGRSKGFAFVEMPSDSEAQAAITALNGKEYKSRTLTVNEARPREDRGGFGSGPRRSGGGDWGGGSGRRPGGRW